VLDDFRPKYLLDVDWPAADAYLGNSPDIDRVDKQPKFTLFPQHYTSARAPNHTYVVTMTYPDAFPRGSHESSEMRHFVATGLPLTIPCDSATCPKVRPPKLKVLVPYEAPDPGHGSGPYRYVFVAFAPANESTEPLQLSTPQNTLRWGRDKDKYGVQGWAAANGLVPVGKTSLSFLTSFAGTDGLRCSCEFHSIEEPIALDEPFSRVPHQGLRLTF
jgi:hypothetical protein